MPLMSGKRLLLVMRHSKSSWKTNEPDHRRPLSGRGTRDAVVAGQTLVTYSPDIVWCSSAARAVQTWQCAQLGGATSPDVRLTDDLYGASAAEMLATLRTTPASANTALLITHEPGASELISSLAVSSPLLADVEARFPTSAIAVLSHDMDWDELAPGTCSLLAFEIPRG
jgi:phosphohistidine phosphatase